VRQLKRHLTVANVLSCTALFIALGGVTYAATLGNKSVKTKHLANGAVTAKKLRGGAVTTPKLRNGAVIAGKVSAGAIGTTQLADGGVRSADLGGGVVTTPKLKDSAVTGAKIASEAVATGQLKDGAVTGAKLASSFFAQLVKNVSYVTGSSGSGVSLVAKTATAECTPSAVQKRVIGGGARIVGDNAEIRLIESGPTFNASGLAVGWTAAAIDESGVTNPWTLQVHAICAEL
jgi:hypothetical protein